MPETLALKISALGQHGDAHAQVPVPPQAHLDDEADGEDQAQGERDGGDVGLVAQADGA